jgi:transcriptional regulator with XRE-family HTH domain
MTKGLPPSATEIAVRRRKLKQLSRNVRNCRSAKFWSQSDLARECWGEYRNPRTGRMSGKNRDRISSIEREKSWPEAHTLALIASALGTTPEELAGETVEQIVEPEGQEFAVMVAGNGLRVNKIVSSGQAKQILAILYPDEPPHESGLVGA